mmetsp:Transcript_8175/g.23251  ORF Transcript_8175/g.23251 Transcript_8175/m.23251 type:complete len:284 (+) Transcript_8175:1093-1944(+)
MGRGGHQRHGDGCREAWESSRWVAVGRWPVFPPPFEDMVRAPVVLASTPSTSSTRRSPISAERLAEPRVARGRRPPPRVLPLEMGQLQMCVGGTSPPVGETSENRRPEHRPILAILVPRELSRVQAVVVEVQKGYRLVLRLGLFLLGAVVGPEEITGRAVKGKEGEVASGSSSAIVQRGWELLPATHAAPDHHHATGAVPTKSPGGEENSGVCGLIEVHVRAQEVAEVVDGRVPAKRQVRAIAEHGPVLPQHHDGPPPRWVALLPGVEEARRQGSRPAAACEA